MLIRQAVIRDARAIARIQLQGWLGYRGMVPDEYLAGMSVESLMNRWLGSLAEPGSMHHLVAELDDESIAGWAAFGANQADRASLAGELGALYVDPVYWNRGAGSALLADSERGLATAGYEHAVLWALAANERTRRFYERRGWRPDGATDTHPSGAEVLRYAKALASIDPEPAGE